jgi:hypothetical protein
METMLANGDIFSNQSPTNLFDFELYTPSKSISTLAIIHNFNQLRVLMTFDFEMINYTTATLTSKYYNFEQENNNISNNYKKANNQKLGLFLNLNKLSIKGGYALFGSPFKTDELNQWSQEHVSGGIGYKVNNYSFDLTMAKSIQNFDEILYQNNSASINQHRSMILATCSYKL